MWIYLVCFIWAGIVIYTQLEFKAVRARLDQQVDAADALVKLLSEQCHEIEQRIEVFDKIIETAKPLIDYLDKVY